MWRTSSRRRVGREGGRKPVKGTGDLRSRRWAGIVAHRRRQQRNTSVCDVCSFFFFLFFWACMSSLRNVRVCMRESHSWRSCCDGVRLSKVKETDPIYSLICWGIKLHDVTLLQFDNYQHMFLISSCSETQVTQVLPFIWSFSSKLGEYSHSFSFTSHLLYLFIISGRFTIRALKPFHVSFS